MNAIVLITGQSDKFGHGHQVRMHNLALELKRRQLTALHCVAEPGALLNLPLPTDIMVLDRRDTGFNSLSNGEPRVRVALDNRGAARTSADIVIDALPHMEMSDVEYESALRHVMLPRRLTVNISESTKAKISLYDSKEAAERQTDLKVASGLLGPEEYLHRMRASRKPALYFGQALFEALFAGKHVQLYPISEYHMKLAEDLIRRLEVRPYLLSALDGLGLTRVADRLQNINRQQQQ